MKNAYFSYINLTIYFSFTNYILLLQFTVLWTVIIGHFCFTWESCRIGAFIIGHFCLTWESCRIGAFIIGHFCLTWDRYFMSVGMELGRIFLPLEAVLKYLIL